MGNKPHSINISQKCHHFISSDTPVEERICAAKGNAELAPLDKIVALFFLAYDIDKNVRRTALETVRNLDSSYIIETVKEGLETRILRFFLKYSHDQSNLVKRLFLDTNIPHEALQEITSFISPQTSLDISKNTQVSGSLSILGLPEFLQVLELNRRNALILVKTARQEGRLYTRFGNLVHATFNEETGENAFNKIIGMQNPSFVYSYNKEETQQTIQKNTQELLVNTIYNPAHYTTQTDITEVQGSLDILDMVELSQIFEYNGKESTIEVYPSDLNSVEKPVKGILFCRNGTVKHAVFGEKEGIEAAHEIFVIQQGSFRIVNEFQTTKETIGISMQGIVLDAMRLLDEKTVSEQCEQPIIEKIPSSNLKADFDKMPISKRIAHILKGRRDAIDILSLDQNALIKKAIKVKINSTLKKILDKNATFQDKKSAAMGNIAVSVVEKITLLFYLAHNENDEIRSLARNTISNLQPANVIEILRTNPHPRIIHFLVKLFSNNQDVCKTAVRNENLDEDTLCFLAAKADQEDINHILTRIEKLPDPLFIIEKLLENKCLENNIKEKLNNLYDKIIEEKGQFQLCGKLSLIDITEIIQCIEQSKKTAVIALENKGTEGIIYFEEGEIIQAYTEKNEEEDAFYEIFSWNDCYFRLTITRKGKEKKKINRDSRTLIMDAAAKSPPQSQNIKQTEGEISGNVLVMDITELALAYESNHKECTLEIKTNEKTYNEKTGRLYFKDGRIINAEIENPYSPLNKKGEEAILSILSWSNGSYKIKPGVDSPETISSSISNLVLESMRLLDEGKNSADDLPEWEVEDEEFENVFSKIQKMSVSEKVKFAIRGNKTYRRILINDQNKLICTAVIRNPQIGEDEIAAVTQNKNINQEVMRLISMNSEWVKKYSTKLNMANNPKTPLEVSIHYLPHFRLNDLILISKNKNIPSTLASYAKKLVNEKSK